MHNLAFLFTFFFVFSKFGIAYSRAYSEYTPPVLLDSISEIDPDYFQEKLSFEPAFKLIASDWHKLQKLKNGSISFLPLQTSKIPKDLNKENPWGIYGISKQHWEHIFWNTVPNKKQWFCDLFEQALDIKNRTCDLNQMGFKIYSKNSNTVPQNFRQYLFSEEGNFLKILLTFEKQENWPTYLKKLYQNKKFILVPDPDTLIDLTITNTKKLNYESLATKINDTFKDIYILANPKQKAKFSKKTEKKDPILQIFDYEPEYLKLYSKPLARNSLVFGYEGPFKDKIILNGPFENKNSLRALETFIFVNYSDFEVGIQQYYLPMQYLNQNIYVHRPIVSWQKDDKVYTAPSVKGLVEYQSLGTRWEKEPPYYSHLSFRMYQVYEHFKDKNIGYETALNYKKIRDFLDNQKPLPKDFAFSLLNPKPSIDSFDDWKKTLPRVVQKELVAFTPESDNITPLTFQKTIANDFERSYWELIYTLSEGLFARTPLQNKNNADCAEMDAPYGQLDPHCDENSLPALAEYFKSYYEDLNLPVFFHEFKWETDFDFKWQGLNDTHRNVITVIHGKDNRPHSEVIILADHYDTAYEGDTYENSPGHRHASYGADDNYSASATLMLAAKYLKSLPLKKDIWLVHLTGEEFPADCLGARMLVTDYLRKKNILADRSNPKIAGVYLMDMIAHKTSPTAIFQISPGRGRQSQELSRVAFSVTKKWNEMASSKQLNKRFSRKNTWKRTDKFKVELPKFLTLIPEIRPFWHFKSSVYNTDAQIFSDARIPVVLFMEDYDIDRKGYHDSLDTIENIDLDYGRAISAIAIESAAQMAMQ